MNLPASVSTPLRVVIAPDSFKGTVTAREVCELLARGWSSVRPHDSVTLLPQADGGEGTLDALEAGAPGTVRHHVGAVTGPDGRATPGEWLELPGRIAVVELAQMSGLPLMQQLDPLGASTFGLGEVIADALDAGMHAVTVALGGSASTDGGAGAFVALGLDLLDTDGVPLEAGGADLIRLATVDASGLRAAPPDGVVVLADVESPLLGPLGAAAVFGPQKGATLADVDLLDRALSRFAEHIGGDPDAPGAGAAGGAAFAFAALWNGAMLSGADFVSHSTGLDAAIASADVVITGEGRFDATSFAGKVVGRVLARAAASGALPLVVAGAVDAETPVSTLSLTDIAGSSAAAMADAPTALVEAGRLAAHRVTS